MTVTGRSLAENLAYGWEMTYGAPPQERLEPYTQWGMNKNQLCLGFWFHQPSPTPSQDVAWVKQNGYGGIMILGFENPSNVELMGELVNDWYGSGNWNHSPALASSAADCNDRPKARNPVRGPADARR